MWFFAGKTFVSLEIDFCHDPFFELDFGNIRDLIYQQFKF